MNGTAPGPRRGRLRTALVAAVGALGALLLVLSAVTAGLRLDAAAPVRALPALGALDYRAAGGDGFVPLRDDYVAAVLGRSGRVERVSTGPFGEGPAAAAAPVLDAAAAAAAAPALAAPPRAPALDHVFTNDDFADAQEVPALPYDGRTQSATATREAGEPTSCSRTGGTAWYRYVPREDGRLVADTFGTDSATTLGVFTGTRLADLREVGCAAGATGEAQVVFDVRGGTSYWFQLAAVLGAQRLVFHLTPLGVTSLASADARDVGVYHRMAAVSGNGRYVAYSSSVGPDCTDARVCRQQQGGIAVLDRATGRRTLVSRATNGTTANAVSYLPSLSHDGRYVGFSSHATNLVDDDTNGSADYFVHDRRTGRTVRASVTSSGEQGRATISSRQLLVHGTLSGDGRYAAFATGELLVDDDNNVVYDVYVHDLRTGRTTIESRAPGGGRTTRQSDFPSLSFDGSIVTYTTSAPEVDGRRERCEPGREETRSCFSLVRRDRSSGRTQVVSRQLDGQPDIGVVRSSMSADGSTVVWTSSSSQVVRGDTNGIVDAFAWDARTGRTTRVSVSSTGQEQVDPTPVVAQADRSFLAPGVRHAVTSADGRYVVFESRADNLVGADDNGATDVFRHDRQTGGTRRVSLSELGEQGDGDSVRPAVSADGLVVVFESDAGGLSSQDGDATTDVYVNAPRASTGRGRVP